MRVLVLMSGGLDSTMAAVSLLEQGHHVVGVTFRMLPRGRDGAAVQDPGVGGAAVARSLGIEHRVVDLSTVFEDKVLGPLATAYAHGTTPNPCVLCNPAVKLAHGIGYARAIGCEGVATGHYARIDRSGSVPRLLRGADCGKDQSYFLYRVSSEALAQMVFPVGEFTKESVREQARSRGLTVWDRPESQDACFRAAGTMIEVITARRPDAAEPGEVVDEEGRVLGVHQGVGHFTVGQRRGLRLGGGSPLYVVRIDGRTRCVTVGPRESLATRVLHLRDCLWHTGEMGEGLTLMARYRAKPVPCSVERDGDRAVARLKDALYGGAPGQSAVVYEGDYVVGGGFIVDGDACG